MWNASAFPVSARLRGFVVAGGVAAVLAPLGPSPGLGQEPSPGGEDPPEAEILREETVLGVVTRRAGVAGRFAHDHLVTAAGYEAELHFHRDTPTEARFELRQEVHQLRVQDPGERERLEERLVELGLLGEGGFQSISDDEREDVREAMLSADQMDAERHPELEVELRWVRPLVEGDRAPREPDAFRHRATVAFTIHGETVERPLYARYALQGDHLTVEGYADAHFTDFGMEPYSAFLGAVRNRDRFHFYVHLEARLAERP